MFLNNVSVYSCQDILNQQLGDRSSRATLPLDVFGLSIQVIFFLCLLILKNEDDSQILASCKDSSDFTWN